MIGKTFGQYEILELLGKGGMGEVYRAHDGKLGRDVAIKLLPPLFTSDPERLARFEREAKVLASLNHPNIAGIHDLEESDGSPFLVMELVEGETLAERLARGHVELEETLQICRQIVEALEAAHDSGIIHRDLKPANVKVTPEGRVKVLDFGLARPHEQEGSGDLADSPTITADYTRPGTLLGTAAYMSPEQARGKPADKRADIWAFGCVMFELLTGRQIFDGETVSDTLAGILKEDPDWRILSDSVPQSIRRLLRRCLTKDPQHRLRDIGDARLEIGETLSGSEIEASSQTQAGRASWHSGIPWSVAPIVGLALAAVVTLLTILAMSLFGAEGGGSVTAFEVTLPEDERLIRYFSGPAVSRDGQMVAFAARSGLDSRIFLQRLDTFEPTPVDGTEGGQNPFFSPDGLWIGFFKERDMYKVSIDGSIPIPMGRGPFWNGQATWGIDDQIIVSESANVRGLRAIDAEDGEESILTTPDSTRGEVAHWWPHILPDGTVLFSVEHNEESYSLARYSPDDRTWDSLGIQGDGALAYLRSGHLIFSRAGVSFIAPFDLSNGTLTGVTIPILNDADPQHIAVSEAGTVAYLHFPEGSDGELVRVERDGNQVALFERREQYRWPRLSPDGLRMAVGINARHSRVSRIWVVDLESGRRNPLQDFGAFNTEPVWTPKGERIVYSSMRSSADLYSQPSTGGISEPLSEETIDQWPTSITEDGVIAFYGGATGSDQDIWVLSSEGEARSVVYGPGEQRGGRFSSDGLWLAYSSTHTGRPQVYVRPYPELSPEWPVSTGGGVEPVWSHDDKELFYRDGNQIIAVTFAPDSGSVNVNPVGQETILFEGDFESDTAGDQSYDVFPDDKQFVMIRPGVAPRLRVITGFTGR